MRRPVALFVAALPLLLAAACGGGGPSASEEVRPPKIAVAEDASVTKGPVEMRPFDLVPEKTIALNADLCDELHVVSLGGEATGLGGVLKLGRGQVLVTRGFSTLDLTGKGRVLVVRVMPEVPCTTQPERTAKVLFGTELTFGGGMYARLAVEGADAKRAYLGYLSGTAPVKEHVHEGSWEVIFAENASGTFTLRGVPQRLKKGESVFVPPGTPHSWTPDPGTSLEAIQLYIPPGPEQRFKALAALEADGGTAKVADAGEAPKGDVKGKDAGAASITTSKDAGVTKGGAKGPTKDGGH